MHFINPNLNLASEYDDLPFVVDEGEEEMQDSADLQDDDETSVEADYTGDQSYDNLVNYDADDYSPSVLDNADDNDFPRYDDELYAGSQPDDEDSYPYDEESIQDELEDNDGPEEGGSEQDSNSFLLNSFPKNYYQNKNEVEKHDLKDPQTRRFFC